MRVIDADRLCEDLLNRWNIADTRKEELIRQVMADIVTPIVVSQPTVNQWIPCSEELPKNGISVFFCDDEGDIYNGYCLVKDGSRYHMWKEYHNADRIKNVVAWMPWPEPWNGGKEE